ncbi:F-box protein At5g49610-like [Camellia sinensis]|uniref:F-box protein At5g49610-like n=1 Tax=Camellia sinensis TaxID=4442 RepID=UPI001036B35C|nr:F-box protein At5g49610-like [Camellia sinensis]
MTKLLVKGNLFLWNPSIRKIVKLPPSLTPVTSNVPKLPSIVGTAVGFGFDQRSNDYKVVKIGYLVDYKSGLDVPWTVEIYFLNTHSWRRYNCVADFCSETFCFGTFSAFANGAVHWIAFVSGLWILRFDMGGEVFREMTLRNHLVKLRDSTTMYVMVLGESLAVVQRDYYSSSQTFQIWVMEEYGVKESWTN